MADTRELRISALLDVNMASFQAGMQTIRGQGAQIGQAFSEGIQPAAQLEGKVRDLGTAAQETGLRFRVLGESINVSHLLAVIAIYSLVHSAISAVKETITSSIAEALKFDESMVRLQVATGASAQQMQAFKTVLAEYAVTARVGFQTSADLAEGMNQIVRAGVPAGQAMQVLQATGRAAFAGFADQKTILEAVIPTLRNFGMDMSRANEVLDLMFKTARLGGPQVADLAANMGPLSAIAKASGQSLDTMFMSLTAMTRATMDSAQAIQMSQRLVQQFLRPNAELAEVIATVTGKTREQIVAENGAIGVAEALMKATGGNVTEIERLMGGVRMSLPFLIALAGNFQVAKQSQLDWNQTGSATGEMLKAQQTVMESATGKVIEFHKQWAELKTTMAGFLVTVGTPILQFLNESAQARTAPYGIQAPQAPAMIDRLPSEISRRAALQGIQAAGPPAPRFPDDADIAKLREATQLLRQQLETEQATPREVLKSQDALIAQIKERIAGIQQSIAIGEKDVKVQQDLAKAQKELVDAQKDELNLVKSLSSEYSKMRGELEQAMVRLAAARIQAAELPGQLQKSEFGLRQDLFREQLGEAKNDPSKARALIDEQRKAQQALFETQMAGLQVALRWAGTEEQRLGVYNRMRDAILENARAQMQLNQEQAKTGPTGPREFIPGFGEAEWDPTAMQWRKPSTPAGDRNKAVVAEALAALATLDKAIKASQDSLVTASQANARQIYKDTVQAYQDLVKAAEVMGKMAVDAFTRAWNKDIKNLQFPNPLQGGGMGPVTPGGTPPPAGTTITINGMRLDLSESTKSELRDAAIRGALAGAGDAAVQDERRMIGYGNPP